MPAPDRVRRILCVCTGNSCRSVMAQGLFRHALQQSRPDVQIMSAGLGTLGGIGPTPETVAVMQHEGIDVSRHIAQPVTPDVVRKADLILVMDGSHREAMLRRFPESASRMFLLKEFRAHGSVGDPNVADPIARPLEVYESCLMTIKEAVQRIVQWLTGQQVAG